MQLQYGKFIPACMVSVVALGQAPWDAYTQAAGWARTDVTGIVTFYDSPNKAIHVWSLDGILSADVNVSKVDRSFQMCFLDTRNNIWGTSGNTLLHVGKTGKVLDTVKLPAEVTDLAWDSKTLVLAFRAPLPYLEARSTADGAVIWAFGPKPERKTAEAEPSIGIAVGEKGQVYLLSIPTLTLSTLDVATGKTIGQTSFTLDGKLVSVGPGTPQLHAVPGENKLVLGVTSSQVPSLGAKGLGLLILDLETKQATYKSTGLSDNHRFIGLIERAAHFTLPGGGMVKQDLL